MGVAVGAVAAEGPGAPSSHPGDSLPAHSARVLVILRGVCWPSSPLPDPSLGLGPPCQWQWGSWPPGPGHRLSCGSAEAPKAHLQDRGQAPSPALTCVPRAPPLPHRLGTCRFSPASVPLFMFSPLPPPTGLGEPPYLSVTGWQCAPPLCPPLRGLLPQGWAVLTGLLGLYLPEALSRSLECLPPGCQAF